MAEDSKRTPGKGLGRALRMGRRVGRRAAKLVLESRTRIPSIPTEPVSLSFELAGSGEPPIVQELDGGISLLAAAARMGVDIDHYCGGQCACGTCRVEILEGAQNLSPQDGMEQMVLGSAHVAAGNRLACQARLLGPVRARIPEWF